MADQPTDFERLPKLTRDPAFLGMTGTQLLGAFNDNVFKQLLVLYYLGLGVDAASSAGGAAGAGAGAANTYQAVAFFVFALPFVLFSGVAGWWSDRVVKRDIAIGSKVAEIGVMLLGLAAFWSGNFYAPFVVLFLMATQSTFFGPSKYGILPEMLRERDLPSANGLVQMTTFLAIILGTVVAGIGKDVAERYVGTGSVWIVCGFCVGIAFLGTYTATLLRRTPVAHPGLKFRAEDVFLSRETMACFRRDRKLWNALLVISMFWFVAGTVQMTANEYGIGQLAAGDTGTSLLQACLAIGIALGCVTAGQLSRNRVRYDFVPRGALGITVTLAGLAFVGFCQNAALVAPWAANVASAVLLFTMGFSTGFFVVPLQVVLQARPPRELKGRIIAAQNLFNFVGMLGSAVFYWGLGQLFLRVLHLPISTVFGVTAVVMLGIAIWYRPSDSPAATGERSCPDCGEDLGLDGPAQCPVCGRATSAGEVAPPPAAELDTLSGEETLFDHPRPERSATGAATGAKEPFANSNHVS
jgi:MFS family permease